MPGWKYHKWLYEDFKWHQRQLSKVWISNCVPQKYSGMQLLIHTLDSSSRHQIPQYTVIIAILLWQCNHDIINSLRPSDATICVGNLTIIGSDYDLSPGRRQAIIWTNAEIPVLLIGPLGINFSEICIKIYAYSFKKMHLKISSA